MGLWSCHSFTYDSTGTITQSLLTVTGIGTTFTLAMQGGIIQYSTGQTAWIVQYNSPTQLTVLEGVTVTGVTYVLYYGGAQFDTGTGETSLASVYVQGLLTMPNQTPSLPAVFNSQSEIVAGQVSLTSGVTGTLPPGNGGTGNNAAITGGKIVTTTAGMYQEGTSATNPTFNTATLANPTNQIVLGNTNTMTVSSPAPASPMTVTIPNTQSDTFAMLGTPQTITATTVQNGIYTGVSKGEGPFAWYNATYSVGTVGQACLVITGSTTTFTVAMLGGIIQYSTGITAFIAAFSSTTSLIASSCITVTAGTSYVIYYAGVQINNDGYSAFSGMQLFNGPAAHFISTYQTGTCSQTTTTVTCVGTTLTAAMVGGIFRFADGLFAFLSRALRRRP